MLLSGEYFPPNPNLDHNVMRQIFIAERGGMVYSSSLYQKIVNSMESTILKW